LKDKNKEESYPIEASANPGGWRTWMGLVLFSLLGGYIVWVFAWQWTRTTTWTVEMEVDHGNLAKWYYDSGRGFSEEEGTYRGFPKGFLRMDFSLPSGFPRNLRFDPTEGEGNVHMISITWKEPWPGGSGTLDFAEADWYGVDELEFAGDGSVYLTVTGIPSDPFAVWMGYPGKPESFWRNYRRALALAGFAFFGGLGYIWNRRVTHQYRN